MRLPIWPRDVVVRVGELLLVRRIPPHVWVVGDARCPEQARIASAELPGGRRGRGAAANPRRAATQRTVVRVHAIQRAQEDQRLHPREHAPVQRSARRQLAPDERVVGVPGRLQRVPHRCDQVAVHARAVLDLQMAGDALGSQARAVVGLVPHRPEADLGKIGRVARIELLGARVVVAAVTRRNRSRERFELLGRRIPVEVHLPVARRAGAGRPQRRSAQQVEVQRDPVRLGVVDDLIPDGPRARRVGGGVCRVEVAGATAG